jgi:hypothetical protein
MLLPMGCSIFSVENNGKLSDTQNNNGIYLSGFTAAVITVSTLPALYCSTGTRSCSTTRTAGKETVKMQIRVHAKCTKLQKE